jgi:hypothetical protein
MTKNGVKRLILSFAQNIAYLLQKLITKEDQQIWNVIIVYVTMPACWKRPSNNESEKEEKRITEKLKKQEKR